MYSFNEHDKTIEIILQKKILQKMQRYSFQTFCGTAIQGYWKHEGEKVCI